MNKDSFNLDVPKFIQTIIINQLCFKIIKINLIADNGMYKI